MHWGKISFIFLILLFTNEVQANPSFSLEPTEVPVPCESREDLSSSLRFQQNSCNIGLRFCSQYKPEMRNLITNSNQTGRMDVYWKYYAQGVDLDFEKSTQKQIVGGNLERNICQVAKGEIKTNAQGKGCGNFVCISRAGGYMGERCGNREASYMEGAWITALQHTTNEIFGPDELNLNDSNGLSTKGKLKLKTLATQGLGKDIFDLIHHIPVIANHLRGKLKDEFGEIQTLNTKGEPLVRNLCAQPLLTQFSNEDQGSATEFCKVQSASKHDSRIDQLRGGACYLKGSRVNTESAFTELVTAEIAFRTSRSFTLTMLSANPDAETVHDERFKKEVHAPCMRRAKRVGKKKRSVSKGVRAYRSCYNARYPKFFQRLVLEHYPNFKIQYPKAGEKKAQTGSSPHEQASLPLFFLIGMIRFRKRKTKRRLMLGTQLIAMTLFIASCGGGCSGGAKNETRVAYCNSSNGTPIQSKELADQCCKKSDTGKFLGDPIVGAEGVPDGCPAPRGSSIGAMSIERGAEAVSRAQEDLVKAAKLICKGEENCDGIISNPNIQAATLADNKGEGFQNGKASQGDSEKDFLSNLPSLRDLAGIASGKKGSSPSSTGGGSAGLPGLKLSGFGDASDSEKEPTPEELAQLLLEEEGNGSLYSGGGKKRSKGSSSFRGLSGFGSKSKGFGKGANKLEFGSAGKSEKDEVLLSEDPEDYFALTSIHADLFKIVERRYRSTSMDWAKEKVRKSYARLK